MFEGSSKRAFLYQIALQSIIEACNWKVFVQHPLLDIEFLTIKMKISYFNGLAKSISTKACGSHEEFIKNLGKCPNTFPNDPTILLVH